MSLDIWTRCAGPSRVAPLAITAFRVVEAQHKVSTRRLVDTLAEQQLLEEIIDEVKPTAPAGAGFAGLHYLLATPFRHPPLRHGSRFGTSNERSLWYGAEKLETSLAEKTYYQLLFLAGTTAVLTNLSCDWSSFSAKVATPFGVDVTKPAFAAFARQLTSPSTYVATQAFGRDMRAAGVVAFAYTSARCPLQGKAVGLFQPAFANRSPSQYQTWRCIVTPDGCEVIHLNGVLTPLVFKRSQFEINGTLPAPSLAS